MEITLRPTIIIPDFDIKDKNNNYKPLVKLTKEDENYLNIWREKARKLYKKYNGMYTIEDEKYLIDPDPFESKWFIFKIKSKSRKPTPAFGSSTPSFTSFQLPDALNYDFNSGFVL
jgi:hypothetical protein